MTGSNRRPQTCKDCALPTELIPHMVGEVGADPTTPEGNGFTVRRSCRFATLPYSFVIGVPTETRTPDPVIKSHVLYQLSYRDKFFGGSSLIRTGNCEFCRLPSYRLTKEPDGTQRRSRTYVKGLEDPCTIRYTSRADGTEGWNRTIGNGLIRAAPSPLGYLCILATDGGVDPHAPLGTLSVFKTGLRAAAIHPPNCWCS